jgi:hypothetical protein
LATGKKRGSGMRNKLCPQCKIHRFYLKNNAGERLVVIVNQDKEIIPIHQEESLNGFDTSVLYCLGCSWQGSVDRLL